MLPAANLKGFMHQLGLVIKLILYTAVSTAPMNAVGAVLLIFRLSRMVIVTAILGHGIASCFLDIKKSPEGRLAYITHIFTLTAYKPSIYRVLNPPCVLAKHIFWPPNRKGGTI